MISSVNQKWLYTLWIFPLWHFFLFGSALFWIDLPLFQTVAHLLALSLPVGVAVLNFKRKPVLLKVNKKISGFIDFNKQSIIIFSIAVFGVLSALKWLMLGDFLYESRMIGFSSILFALNYASWFFLGFGLYSALQLKKNSLTLLTIFAILIEFSFVFITGVRQDLLLYLLLLFLIVLFARPQIVTISRISFAAVFTIVMLMVMFFSRTQRVDSDVTFQSELSQLSDYAAKSAERFYAEPIAFSKVTSMTPESVDFVSSDAFFSSIKTAFTPRFLDNNKPELRPGNEFYQKYFSGEEKKSHISYPTGIFTDTYRVWGNWSPLATLLLSGIAVLFWWILFQSGIPLWLGSFIFISELAVGNHIPFWLTGWLRLLILALIVCLILGLVQKIVETLFYPQENA